MAALTGLLPLTRAELLIEIRGAQWSGVYEPDMAKSILAISKAHLSAAETGQSSGFDVPVRAATGWMEPGQRFGFHNLRHSLTSLLITGKKADVRTTQDIMRHSNSSTTIELYTQSPMELRIAAQEQVLSAILEQPTTGRAN